jgi:uncharacterized protein (DUF58 family)
VAESFDPVRESARRFLDPEIASAIKSMELRARLVVEGFIAGLHKSPYHGFSVEFAEHRQYLPGDDLRTVDWKVYAKTDRYYIKQYEEETNLKGYLLLDCSKSMEFRSGAMISKFMYASMLASALAYLMIRQRDAAGLVSFDQKIRTYIPPRSAGGHLHRLLSELDKQQPGEQTDVGAALHQMAERISRRGLVIVLSDLLDDPSKIISGLKHFRHNGHELIVFQILDPRERDLQFSGEALFRDMETGEEISTVPDQIRSGFKKEMTVFMDELKRACRESLIDYHVIDTSMPFDKALFQFLSKRGRLG